MWTMVGPNIIVIMSDEHDPFIAQDGIRFQNAYCNSPLCVPSRFSFMSGRYAHQVNAFDNGSPFPTSIPTIGNYLEAAGSTECSGQRRTG